MATEILWVSLEERSWPNSPHQRFHSELFCKIVRYFCRTLYKLSGFRSTWSPYRRLLYSSTVWDQKSVMTFLKKALLPSSGWQNWDGCWIVCGEVTCQLYRRAARGFFFWKRGQTLHGANANWQKLNKRHKNASSHILTSGSKVEGQVAYIRSSLFGRTSRSLYRVLILSDNCALSLPAVTPTWTGSGTQ